MKKQTTSDIDWLNLDDTFSDDTVFGFTQNDLDDIGEQIRLMEASSPALPGAGR